MTESDSESLPRTRDERQIRAEVEVKTPGWMPGGKVGLSYSRVWDKRTSDFVRSVSDQAGTSEEALFDRIEQGDGFADVFAEAGQYCVKNGDPVFTETISKLVAAALMDDAIILETSYLLDKLESHLPIHIRIIFALDREDVVPANRIIDRVRASRGLTMAVLGEFNADGFANKLPAGERYRGQSFTEDNWYLTPLGQSLRDIVEEVDRKNRVSR